MSAPTKISTQRHSEIDSVSENNKDTLFKSFILSLSSSPRIFWVFWPISTMLSSGWSQFILWFLILHRLHLYRVVRLSTLNKHPGYEIKQSVSEAPIMLDIWEMRCTPSLLLLSGPLWSSVVVRDKGFINGSNRTAWHLNWVQSNDICLIELFGMELWLFNCKQMTYVYWIVWNWRDV